MATKLLPKEIPLNESQKKSKVFHVPNFNGKFGLALFVGKKEVFIGVCVGEVEIEQIVRKKMLRISAKAKVKTFNFDTI